MDLKGIWKKTTQSDCGSRYPAQIEFKANGFYDAQPDAGAGQRPAWNTGYWALLGGQLQLSTSEHPTLTYDIFLRDGALTVKDSNGCIVDYRK